MFIRTAKRSFAALALLAAALAGASAATETAWMVSPDKSRLIFNYSEDGAPAVGGFSRFKADASFDPAAPETARMALEIEMDSVELSDSLRTGFVKGDDWFDTADHPTATFELTRMAPTQQPSVFTVEGVLTIKGVSREISAPTLVVVDGDRALARGELSFDRRDFGVDGDVPLVTLGTDVTVVFSLVAKRG